MRICSRSKLNPGKAFAALLAVVLLSLSFLLLSFSGASAFENEPDGFRDIKWGTRIADLPSMELQNEYDDGVAIYTRKEEDLYVRKIGSIGKVRLKSIKYYFYNDKFFKVVVEYDASKASEIRTVLDSKHGNPNSRNARQDSFVVSDNSHWNGKKVDIDFIHQTEDNSGQSSNTGISKYIPDCDVEIAGRANVISCIKYIFKPVDEMRSDESARLQ
jgi:hypothetical protein